MKPTLVSKFGAFTVTPNAFIMNMASLSGSAVKVFLTLEMHVNTSTEDSIAFPAYERLQTITGLGTQAIASGIRELISTGWLERKKRYGASNVYTLTMPDPANLPPPVLCKSKNSPLKIKEQSFENQRLTRPINKTHELDVIAPEGAQASKPAAPRPNIADLIFERAMKSRDKSESVVRAWNLPPYLEEICLWFAEDMTMVVTKGDKGKWARGASRLYEFHATREQHRAACERARSQRSKDGQKILYTHPESMVSLIRAMVSEPAPPPPEVPAQLVTATDSDGYTVYRRVTQ